MATKSRSPAPPQRKTNPNSSKPKIFHAYPDKPPRPSYNYPSDGVADYNIFNLESGTWHVVRVVTLVAFFVRIFRIYHPTSVVFDEVHFGGFANYYIQGKFFMDVHPPLGKMLITLAGWLAGYDGEFDFKEIGKDYLETAVPYVAMRLFPAICGVLTVPTVFLTLKATGCKTSTATLGAGLIIFENGLITQSRLILLDSPLVMFIALTALSWVSFTNQNELGPSKAFSPSWWFWLAATGVFLGATASVKWVGLFTIAWVGSLTALQLWVLLGDTRNVTVRVWFKHLFARIFCLIVIPITFYMAMFAIHFICLSDTGDGDGYMSPEFQSTLNDNGMADVPADVAFGSRISLRHHNTQGGYLHSHPHMYPTGSKQQQITLYLHDDENNVWLLENQTQPIDWASDPTGNTDFPGPFAWDAAAPENIVDGSVIRLYHTFTNRRLHSHNERPPVTEADWQNEVTAYGYDGFEGDANDLFRVQIVKSMSEGKAAKERLRTIQTKFQLVHVMTGCTLFSHDVKLPDWGFEQQEVTCARGGTLPNSIWYVESNVHPQLEDDAEMVNYRDPGFFGKFWELQKVMWITNAGLVEEHPWDSRPPSWPILRRGINYWAQDNRQVYLQGNPLIWWSSTAAIGLYALFKGLSLLRWQRSCNDYNNVVFKRFDYEIGQSVLGWAFHYFPFYLMQRQLFLHHYFPALIFAIISLCQIYDFLTIRIRGFGVSERPAIGLVGAVVFLAASIVVFRLYAPLAYGNKWTTAECNRVQLFETWDWDCDSFHEDYDDYDLVQPTAIGVAEATAQDALGPQWLVADDPKAEAHVTPRLQQADVLGSTEQIEFLDEDGNLVDPEFLKSLEGPVIFSMHYDTRTLLVDLYGNELFDGVNVNIDEFVSSFEESVVEEFITTAEPESEVGKETAKDEL